MVFMAKEPIFHLSIGRWLISVT